MRYICSYSICQCILSFCSDSQNQSTIMSSENTSVSKPLYRDINADDDDPEVMELDSYCVNCEQNVRKWFSFIISRQIHL